MDKAVAQFKVPINRPMEIRRSTGINDVSIAQIIASRPHGE